MHFSTTILLATLPLLIAGQTYKASITEYGTGDERGSRNCNTKTTACGFFTLPGYSAAASENIFGKGDGQGHGPGCGTCWRLTGHTDSKGHRLSQPRSIVVKVRMSSGSKLPVYCPPLLPSYSISPFVQVSPYPPKR